MATSKLPQSLQDAAVTICSEMYGESMGGRNPQKMEKGEYGGRDSLEKGKYLVNSYTAARVNVYYKLSSFFAILFQKWNRDINGSLTLLDFFPGIISGEGTSYFNEWEVSFQWGIHFQVGRAPHLVCICFYEGRAWGGAVGRQKNLQSRRHPNHASPHQGKPWLVL